MDSTVSSMERTRIYEIKGKQDMDVFSDKLPRIRFAILAVRRLGIIRKEERVHSGDKKSSCTTDSSLRRICQCTSQSKNLGVITRVTEQRQHSARFSL